MKRVKKAVIPIAGMGTRFLPITKSCPKEMLPIIDKPTIHLIVEEVVNSGIEEILFITSPYKKIIEDYFDVNYELRDRLTNKNQLDRLDLLNTIPNNVKIYFLRQGEPLGTAHAINLAKEFVGNDPFAVIYGDDIVKGDIPALKQLIELYEKHDANIIGVSSVDPDEVNKYGMVEYDNEFKINNIVEKPEVGTTKSTSAVIGRFIFKPEIFKEIDKLEMKNGEYYITDAIDLLIEKQSFYGCLFKGTWYDTGNQIGYLKANIGYAFDNDEIKSELMKYIRELNNCK